MTGLFRYIVLFYFMAIVKSKIISRRIEMNRPEKLFKTLNIREFYEKRNKILIIRAVGGLGDILMHRMMFEDFKRIMPDAEIHFATPRAYHDAVIDHPYIDKVIDSGNYNKSDYMISFNTTTCCGRTEMKLAPFAGPNRSDIWASHCGLILTQHNMHIHLTEKEQVEGKELLEKYRDREGPIVLVSPISAMQHKNLSDQLLLELINGLRERKLCPIAVHSEPIYKLLQNNIPMLAGMKIRQWMSVIHQSNYVVSVDTSTFHAAGGMKKPLVGIFTFANSDSYGKYYPTAELLQGPCEYNYNGCYNWGLCPAQSKILPCLKQITSQMILDKVDIMLAKWPADNSS